MADRTCYTTGKWAGLVQYRCTRCDFDALEEWRILEHFHDRHEVPEAMSRPMGAILYGPRGELLGDDGAAADADDGLG